MPKSAPVPIPPASGIAIPSPARHSALPANPSASPTRPAARPFAGVSALAMPLKALSAVVTQIRVGHKAISKSTIEFGSVITSIGIFRLLCRVFRRIFLIL